MEKTVLHIQNLTNGLRLSRDKVLVLQKNLNMQLQSGEFVCLLGPNGAGKSTLLRILMRFLPAWQGRITYNDRNVKDIPLKELAKTASVVLTDRFTDPYLTGIDVVSLGRYPYSSWIGQLTDEDLEIINKTAQSLGIEGLMGKVFQQMSDGEKQKILIARALVQDTPFIFLDEPIAFVDSPGRIETMEMLSGIAHKHNKGILMTTHDIETALEYADVLWLMNRDKPLATGIPEDLAMQGRINAYFDKSVIQFDRFSARFRMQDKPLSSTIFIKNTSLETFWLWKALSRKGFKLINVDTLPKKGIGFYFENEEFIMLENDQHPRKFSNIQSVLDELENI
jgi:iron complex transport system ATP-binding protein